MVLSLFSDGPEYVKRRKTPFRPPTASLAQVRAKIPSYLYQKSTTQGIYYVARDTAFILLFYKLGVSIDSFCAFLTRYGLQPALVTLAKCLLWPLYWYWQSLGFAGWWCLGHEAGHGTVSQFPWVNTVIGFTLHSFLFVPYFAWRSTHHAHHKATSSVEREENYVPYTRSDYRLPPASIANHADYHEIFEDTPLYTLLRMLCMQLLGWQAYLCTNVMGSVLYRGKQNVNHFSPSSPLFKPHERNSIIYSNLGLSVMALIMTYYTRQAGFSKFVTLYFVPYLLANHWIIMLTYLHHSDPTIPHYRNKQWTWLRGALATVDRPLLGWAGRFFLHNVSHDHIAHHLFSNIPFYNQPQVTEIIKGVLKDDYNFDSTNTFRALWRTFTECCFIEDEGDIVFYKNKNGEAAREVGTGY